MMLEAILLLALGTYAMRLTGPLLGDRLIFSDRVNALLALSAAVLLFALAIISTLADGREFAGFARVAGVGIGGVLAYRGASFIICVGSAALITATLRWAGIA